MKIRLNLQMEIEDEAKKATPEVEAVVKKEIQKAFDEFGIYTLNDKNLEKEVEDERFQD